MGVMKYRVKEFNSAYDHIFGEGKGWIYVSNEYRTQFWASVHSWWHHYRTGLKTIVDVL